jgi:hypothetical protein
VSRTHLLVGVAVCLALAGLASPFASSSPDGLERVAEEHGIVAAAPVWTAAPAPDYTMPGVSDARLSTGAAGLVGTLVVLALGVGLARLLARRRA